MDVVMEMRIKIYHEIENEEFNEKVRLMII